MFNPSLSHRQTLKKPTSAHFGGYHKPINQLRQNPNKPKGPSSPGCTDCSAITPPAHPFLLINNVKERQRKSLPRPVRVAVVTSAAPRRWRRVIGPSPPPVNTFFIQKSRL
jgi:hypothetical protein